MVECKGGSSNLGTRLIRDADSGSIKPNRQNVQQGSEQYKQQIIENMKREWKKAEGNKKAQLKSILDKFENSTVKYTLIHQATDSATAYKANFFNN